ncbi:uncharacterized protein TRIVIDRAFT_198722 [Trichoderma virens Gv29-8]|uniref:beta-glucosidase n=1 Tax=Hypocrea virens (strain Gv29-8 / FGSC 10586) TaxID=413071 RepID=G9MJW9_HYPVG|nr:uncharacterized protein TRIVIDRAFT_198722 [Trichoderma virens Gv29-8]EHK25906.1 hypothetical protein TRIVIDRAFT_198722 [Trichoderma virens Gv29-8]UKZ48400.1 hypothetical protein TrVGV298_002623 [Trichoderma virens]
MTVLFFLFSPLLRDHAKLIREIGGAAAVLLKNDNSVLPLKSPSNIGVFGNDAADLTDGLVYQDPPATNARAELIGARVQYILRNDRLSDGGFHSIYPTPDVCILFLKTFAAEGYDRVSFEAGWNSSIVVTNVADKCNNTVVVTHSAGINTMTWATHPNVKAFIAAHFPGEQTGNSIVDILWGDVNPSGRLPYTIPVRDEDYNITITNLTSDQITYPGAWPSNFTEGLLIDYRHFDALQIDPLYEFGFGLSYMDTTFDLASNISIKTLVERVSAVVPFSNSSSGPLSDLFTPLINGTVSVSYTGDLDGATDVQLYISLPVSSARAGTPVRVLRGFSKVQLAPSEQRMSASH